MAGAYRCEGCDNTPDWDLERHGDAVASWACRVCLPEVIRSLQRRWEITEISVKPSRRAIRVFRHDDGLWSSRCFRCHEWIEMGVRSWPEAFAMAAFHAVLFHEPVNAG